MVWRSKTFPWHPCFIFCVHNFCGLHPRLLPKLLRVMEFGLCTARVVLLCVWFQRRKSRSLCLLRPTPRTPTTPTSFLVCAPDSSLAAPALPPGAQMQTTSSRHRQSMMSTMVAVVCSWWHPSPVTTNCLTFCLVGLPAPRLTQWIRMLPGLKSSPEFFHRFCSAETFFL